MNDFIDGAIYQVIDSNPNIKKALAKYSKSKNWFYSDDFDFGAGFLKDPQCTFTVELVEMGPAPTMPTPRPVVNINDTLELLGLSTQGAFSECINRLHYHLVDNYCIAEDAGFEAHILAYRKGCTDKQSLCKAIKRIRRQNKQYEELHATRRQLEQRVKVLTDESNEIHNALFSIGNFGVSCPDAYSQAKMISEDIVYLEKTIKELNEKYVAPVEKMREVFADHSNKFFKPTTLNQARVSMGCEPIKSDGLSSSYYSLMINGNSVETEDVIRDVFGNDFDFGNVLKCLVRMYGAKQGAGKAGASIEYDGNKIHYSINKIAGKGNDRG